MIAHCIKSLLFRITTILTMFVPTMPKYYLGNYQAISYNPLIWTQPFSFKIFLPSVMTTCQFWRTSSPITFTKGPFSYKRIWNQDELCKMVALSYRLKNLNTTGCWSKEEVGPLWYQLWSTVLCVMTPFQAEISGMRGIVDATLHLKELKRERIYGEGHQKLPFMKQDLMHLAHWTKYI